MTTTTGGFAIKQQFTEKFVRSVCSQQRIYFDGEVPLGVEFECYGFRWKVSKLVLVAYALYALCDVVESEKVGKSDRKENTGSQSDQAANTGARGSFFRRRRRSW